MTRMLVAAHFTWDDYPGLRVGYFYAGKPDMPRNPRGQTHAVASVDATETMCGLSRRDFPLDFPDTISLRFATPCTACDIAAGPATP